MNKKIFLRVKIRHLAEEAKIIRDEKNKARDGDMKCALHDHKVQVVRPAARNTQLAYAFLRGKRYSSTEAPKRPLVWGDSTSTEVLRMVNQYCPDDRPTPSKEEIKLWFKD